MSKYKARYTSATKGEMEIDAMPNGYLHNAARKLRAEVDEGLDVSDYQRVVLECMELEIAAREAAKGTPEPPDDEFGGAA